MTASVVLTTQKKPHEFNAEIPANAQKNLLQKARNFEVYTGKNNQIEKDELFCTVHKANALGTKILLGNGNGQKQTTDVLSIYQALATNPAVRKGAEAFIAKHNLDISADDLLLVACEDEGSGQYSFQFFHTADDGEIYSESIEEYLTDGRNDNEEFLNDKRIQKVGITGLASLPNLAQQVLEVTQHEYDLCLAEPHDSHTNQSQGTNTSANNVVGPRHSATLPMNISKHGNSDLDDLNGINDDDLFNHFRRPIDDDASSDDDVLIYNNNNNIHDHDHDHGNANKLHNRRKTGGNGNNNQGTGGLGHDHSQHGSSGLNNNNNRHSHNNHGNSDVDHNGGKGLPNQNNNNDRLNKHKNYDSGTDGDTDSNDGFTVVNRRKKRPGNTGHGGNPSSNSTGSSGTNQNGSKNRKEPITLSNMFGTLDDLSDTQNNSPQILDLILPKGQSTHNNATNNGDNNTLGNSNKLSGTPSPTARKAKTAATSILSHTHHHTPTHHAGGKSKFVLKHSIRKVSSSSGKTEDSSKQKAKHEPLKTFNHFSVLEEHDSGNDSGNDSNHSSPAASSNSLTSNKRNQAKRIQRNQGSSPLSAGGGLGSDATHNSDQDVLKDLLDKNSGGNGSKLSIAGTGSQNGIIVNALTNSMTSGDGSNLSGISTATTSTPPTLTSSLATSNNNNNNNNNTSNTAATAIVTTTTSTVQSVEPAPTKTAGVMFNNIFYPITTQFGKQGVNINGHFYEQLYLGANRQLGINYNGLFYPNTVLTMSQGSSNNQPLPSQQVQQQQTFVPSARPVSSFVDNRFNWPQTNHTHLVQDHKGIATYNYVGQHGYTPNNNHFSSLRGGPNWNHPPYPVRDANLVSYEGVVHPGAVLFGNQQRQKVYNPLTKQWE